MKRTDLKVWFACNNHCSFCVQWDKRNQYKPRKIAEIRQIIEDEYKNGSRGIVFTWGEPTVHPDLVEAVQHANNTGFLEIQIQSNGRTFCREEYVLSLIEAWVTEFSPAIHGFHKETHDTLAGSKWAWDEVVKWLIILKKLHQKIIINSVITQANYQEIPLLAKLLITLGVTQFQFAFVHILWSAAKNKETVVPKKSDVMPYIYKALDLAKSHNVPAFTEAIPYCLMQGYEYAISENIMPDTVVVDAEYRTDNYEEYRLSEGKAKHKKCQECTKDEVCEWPWKEYPEIYGWDEFVPITQ